MAPISGTVRRDFTAPPAGRFAMSCLPPVESTHEAGASVASRSMTARSVPSSGTLLVEGAETSTTRLSGRINRRGTALTSGSEMPSRTLFTIAYSASIPGAGSWTRK